MIESIDLLTYTDTYSIQLSNYCNHYLNNQHNTKTKLPYIAKHIDY